MIEILKRIKVETGLTGDNSYDQVILNHIDTVRQMCEDAGIKDEDMDFDPYFIQLCLIYSKTFIGYKQDGSVRELPTSFDKILFQYKSSFIGRQK